MTNRSSKPRPKSKPSSESDSASAQVAQPTDAPAAARSGEATEACPRCGGLDVEGSTVPDQRYPTFMGLKRNRFECGACEHTWERSA